MQIKQNVLVSTDGFPFVTDLADFPHGDLVSVRKDDNYDIEFYAVAPGTKVAAYDESTGLPVFHDVKYWSIHRGKQIEIVNLDDGRQIVTDNDPRAIYGISIKSDSIEFGRFTPSEAMDKGVMVPVSDCAVASSVDGMMYDFADGLIKSERTPTGVTLDYKFGQFVGIMVGDGWSDSINTVSLSDNEGFNADFIANFLKSGPYPDMYITIDKFSSDIPGRYGDTVRHRFNVGNKVFGLRVKELVDGHRDAVTSGSANKRLPIWYQFAGRDFISGLVNGMIATDGTVCLSHGKSKPQLQISFSSTSLRLVREFKRCCQLLGVKASISFSKNTSGGNTSWLCSVSTIDAKRVNLLSDCCHERKRDTFLSAEVQTGDMYIKNDIVPFPVGFAKRLIPLVPAAKTHGVDLKKLDEEEAHRRLKYQSTAVNVRAHANKGFITRGLARRIREVGEEIAEKNIKAYEAGWSVIDSVCAKFERYSAEDPSENRRSWKVEMSPCEADLVAAAVSAAKPRVCSSWKSEVRPVTLALSMIRKTGFVTLGQLDKTKEFFGKYSAPNTELRDSEDLKALMRLVDSDVSWVGIKSVEKTGKVEVGYDLTVPGPDTFMSDDGIILSNTVNIHVPASEKAAKQAFEKMLPSKNLFSLTDMKSVRYKPEKEQISGLWALTRGRTRKPTRVFQTKAEATAAYRNGEIGPNDPVEIKELSHET